MTLKKMLLASVFFLFSCGDKSQIPSEIITPDKMQLVLFDVLRADAFVFDFIKKDSTKNVEEESIKLQQQIFIVHKVTKEAFYKSYDFYKTRPDLMLPLLDSMINKATRDKYMNTKSGGIGNHTIPDDFDIKTMLFKDTAFNKNLVLKSRLFKDTLFSITPIVQHRVIIDSLFNKKIKKKNRLFNYKLNAQ